MAIGTQAAETALIESVCERVRERLAPEEAAEAEAFVRRYYRRAPAEDLRGREPVDLYGAALSHWSFGRNRAPGEARVRVYNPTFEQHGWQSPHTAIEVVSDDMPFLVDSVSMELNRRELGIHVLVHPVIGDESYMHLEVDHLKDGFEALAEGLRHVLAQVRAVVEDWQPMRERMQAVTGLDEEPQALLAWLVDHHFTFLGYRGPDGPGLGLLRDTEFDRLGDEPLVLTKADARSPIHRPSYLDYVGVGEHRFLGLYTTAAYRSLPWDIPVLRRKAAAVRERVDFPPGSHDDKALVEIIDTFPRDELFQMTADELYDVVNGILELGERQRVRLFLRTDRYQRFVSALVFLPRDRFNTANRVKIGELLAEAVGAGQVDWDLRLTELVLVRIGYTLRVPSPPSYDVEALERQIVEITRGWDDELAATLGPLIHRYEGAFPAAYRDDWPARSAPADVERIEALGDDALDISLYKPLEASAGTLRCKLYKRGERVSLSGVLPMFESMGLTVTDERPYRVTPRDAVPAWIYDFGLAARGDVDAQSMRERFHDGFARIWNGDAELDGYNGLILAAGLDWREVTVLRAVARYLRQVGISFSDRYMELALLAHPDIATQLVRLFEARFDPAGPRAGDSSDIEAAIDAVESLDEDRILRGFLSVVHAMLRTNYYVPGAACLAFKLDPSQVPLLPLPRPKFEIFVHSPRVEGVHLRGGSVARGGLRWSDRREDFRTEVLGLMKAQMVKNALIVPVGAKGGFVVKRTPATREEVVACYQTFIGALLDLTDNYVGSEVVPPKDVVRHDPDDPYLVVAADKGTATFSDIANGVAIERGFWLGDAFASGGSVGYDHKAMGITARSAWVSVQRHFRELGVDVQAEDFTVVGVGDMSGDVFGNGMLLSEHIELIGAFDHRHVFLDPNPDPAASHAERRRLFDLPRSSWDDYHRELISEGGGVFARSAKSIPLSPQVRERLGVEADHLTPVELMSALLKAPVDLLWNGGIGTYVKASSETHADVGDKANDALRVNGRDLRARVVGEGGNLGLTQRGRIEYALSGGAVNTDAIDNAGGVNCSDHEVNLKVLLDTVVAEGDMTVKQRDALLADMTDAVAERVLRGSYTQTQALSIALAQAPSMLDVHDRLMRDLEGTGRLDRALEALPDNDTIAERRQNGMGLTQPELAVILAYSKITLYAALLDSDLPEDPALGAELGEYFPSPLPERYGDVMRRHRLRREIVATRVTNDLVDRAGTTLVFRLREDTGASAADIARACAVVREVFRLRSLWEDVESLDGLVAANVQYGMLLESRRMAERAARWLLRHRRPIDIAAEIARHSEAARVVGEVLSEDGEEWVAAGVPAELAARVAIQSDLFYALDIAEVALSTGHDLREVAELHFELGGQLVLHWLRDQVAALPRTNRWQAMARAALRDDLFALHASLTAAVLQAGGLDAWREAHQAALERTLEILAEIRAGGTFDLTTLPVALREVRNLL